MKRTILAKVRDNLKSIFKREKKSDILIACSGGMDSLALLYLINEIKNDLHFNIAASYVNHKIRPESDEEAKFVEKICQNLGTPFFPLEFPDNFWLEQKTNLEERARIQRYKLLTRLAKHNNYGMLATAHHQEDQVETVLMRIFDRGCGIKGICGIGELSGKTKESFSAPSEETIAIIRPILNVSKAEIAKYMQGKKFVVDLTNYDTKYRRNYYRKSVIPAINLVLKDLPYKENIARLAENAAREKEVVETFLFKFWQNRVAVQEENKSNVKFFIEKKAINSNSYNFWLTAFSYFFTFHNLKSPSTRTLKDIVNFIFKSDPKKTIYHPFKFERNRDGTTIEKLSLKNVSY